MARRKNIYVCLHTPQASLPSPNEMVPQVTTEIRIFYPSNTSRSVLREQVTLAFDQAREQINEKVDIP